jgi:hypothetical protein
MKAGTASRTTLTIACAGTPQWTDKTVAMYGSFDNIGPTTVGIVVRQAQALLEHTPEHATPQTPNQLFFDTCAWAIVTLRRAGFGRYAALDEVKSMQTVLSEDEMRRVEERSADIWREGIRREEGREPDAYDL